MGANKDLGLPVGKMSKVIVAFDVDGTLIEKEKVHEDIVKMAKTLDKFKNVIVIVWSGQGTEYARDVGRKLKFNKSVLYASKSDYQAIRDNKYPIIAIDDIQDTAIGDINLIVRNK